MNEQIPFSINQLKITHFHWNSGEIKEGTPIRTSVELKSEFDFEINKLRWFKTVTHQYYRLSLGNGSEKQTYTEEVNIPEIISSLNKINLRNLKNNYFSETIPERYTHWEIKYNYYFKIVGTYNNEIEEFKEICYLIDFEKIINEELDKVEKQLKEE